MGEQIQINDTFDFTKDIKDITLNATYIFALEQLMMFYISNMENPADVKPIIQKFESYVKGEYDIQKNPFTEIESHLYTIFSLQQLLRAKAYEQGLNIKVNATLEKDLIEELLKATLENDNEKVKEIHIKMQKQIESQLS